MLLLRTSLDNTLEEDKSVYQKASVLKTAQYY